MTAHLHIERLTIEGLPRGRGAPLRVAISEALEALLTPGEIARIETSLPPRMPPISYAPATTERAAARQIARAIRDALLPEARR